MIPVTQTKVVVKNTKGEIVQDGNCFAAAIACILEIPITDVPNVETLFIESLGNLWYQVMTDFCKAKGYEFGPDGRCRVFHEPDFKPEQREEYINALKDTYYIATGLSIRGFDHCCIYKNGQFIFDPHPTREGLVNLKYFETLIKIKQ